MRSSRVAAWVACWVLAAAPAWAVTVDAKVDRWLEGAAAANAAGDAETRRVLATAAVKRAPEHVDALFALGRYLAYDGEYARAERLLVRALQLAPDYRDVALQLARVLAWDGRYAAAAGVADTLLVKHGDWVDAHVVRGDIALWSGDPPVAESHYRAALALSPDDPALQDKVLDAVVAEGDARRVRAALDALPRSEDDADRRRLRRTYAIGHTDARLDLALGYTFTEGGDWTTGQGGAMFRLVDTLWLGGRVELERRDYGGDARLVDTTLAMPVTWSPSDRTYMLVEPGGTPNADFAPELRLVAQFGHDPLRWFGWSLGARYARYETASATSVYPSLTFHIWPVAIEPTLIATFTTDGQVDLTGRLKVRVNVTDSGVVEVWGFLGSEPVDATLAATLDAPRQAGVVLGLGQDINPLARMRFTYAYTTPIEDGVRVADAVSRHALVLSFTQKFRFARRGR